MYQAKQPTFASWMVFLCFISFLLQLKTGMLVKQNKQHKDSSVGRYDDVYHDTYHSYQDINPFIISVVLGNTAISLCAGFIYGNMEIFASVYLNVLGI